MWKIGQKIVCVSTKRTSFQINTMRIKEGCTYEFDGNAGVCECGLEKVYLKGLLDGNVINNCACGSKTIGRIRFIKKRFEPIKEVYSGNAISEILEKFKPLEKETDIEVKELETAKN